MTVDIFHSVVDHDLCVGCGACAAVQRETLVMTWSDDGFFQPVRKTGFEGELDPRTLAVCPFNQDDQNEDRIAERLYADGERIKQDKYIGFYEDCLIGFCTDSTLRGNATSGGIISWIIRHVLNNGLVDRVIAVGDSDEEDRLFSFKSYHSVGVLDVPMKSRYYPSEFSNALQSVIDEPGSALVIGLPCQIKAVRKLALLLPEVDEKIKYTVSLFCGHQKSRHYVDYLALHVGVDPDCVVSIDYRRKRAGCSARAYGFEIKHKDGPDVCKTSGATGNVFASSWSNNLFMNPACEFCDDVVGETADLSVGDAWLPAYASDSRGTSICVLRHPVMLEAMKRGQEMGELSLEETDPHTVYMSQAGGFRQRREALQCRLALAKKQGRKVPAKRVLPSANAISVLDQIQQYLRIRIRKTSNHVLRRSASHRDLTTFRRKLGFLVMTSNVISLMRRIQRRLHLR
jgi:coenzyme F420 hydrogenase subunit beta